MELAMLILVHYARGRWLTGKSSKAGLAGKCIKIRFYDDDVDGVLMVRDAQK